MARKVLPSSIQPLSIAGLELVLFSQQWMLAQRSSSHETVTEIA
jgi:hypothetical protein